MTLQMYADRKKWPLKEVRVTLTHSKNYANDSSTVSNRQRCSIESRGGLR